MRVRKKKHALLPLLCRIAKQKKKSLGGERGKKKNDARRSLPSAPPAEAPGGSAIALTPVRGTEAVTPEAESGRKRRRVASGGTLARDDEEKESRRQGFEKKHKGEREQREEARSPL